MPIGADKLIEIEGVYGIITKSVVCDYNLEAEGVWKWTDCDYVASAGNGGKLKSWPRLKVISLFILLAGMVGKIQHLQKLTCLSLEEILTLQ